MTTAATHTAPSGGTLRAAHMQRRLHQQERRAVERFRSLDERETPATRGRLLNEPITAEPPALALPSDHVEPSPGGRFAEAARKERRAAAGHRIRAGCASEAPY